MVVIEAEDAKTHGRDLLPLVAAERAPGEACGSREAA